jgi:hypothetical protein
VDPFSSSVHVGRKIVRKQKHPHHSPCLFFAIIIAMQHNAIKQPPKICKCIRFSCHFCAQETGSPFTESTQESPLWVDLYQSSADQLSVSFMSHYIFTPYRGDVV